MSDEKLRKVGALWRPRPDAQSKGYGELTINGMKQRFAVFPNEHKEPGTRQPDYVLLSSDPPERDEYAPPEQDQERAGRPVEDQIPF